MSPDEKIRKAAGLGAEFRRQVDAKDDEEKSRKNTKKEIEREERAKLAEETGTKNIRSIYKQLVKILHPDPEQNEEVKLQK